MTDSDRLNAFSLGMKSGFLTVDEVRRIEDIRYKWTGPWKLVDGQWQRNYTGIDIKRVEVEVTKYGPKVERPQR